MCHHITTTQSNHGRKKEGSTWDYRKPDTIYRFPLSEMPYKAHSETNMLADGLLSHSTRQWWVLTGKHTLGQEKQVKPSSGKTQRAQVKSKADAVHIFQTLPLFWILLCFSLLAHWRCLLLQSWAFLMSRKEKHSIETQHEMPVWSCLFRNSHLTKELKFQVQPLTPPSKVLAASFMQQLHTELSHGQVPLCGGCAVSGFK